MDTRFLLMAFLATQSQTAARSLLELARLPADACLDLHYRPQKRHMASCWNSIHVFSKIVLFDSARHINLFHTQIYCWRFKDIQISRKVQLKIIVQLIERKKEWM
jgi:hypothetical protein